MKTRLRVLARFWAENRFTPFPEPLEQRAFRRTQLRCSSLVFLAAFPRRQTIPPDCKMLWPAARAASPIQRSILRSSAAGLTGFDR